MNSTDEKICACHPVLIANGDNKEIFQVSILWMLLNMQYINYKELCSNLVLIANGDNKEIFKVPTLWMLPLPYTAVLRHPHNAILQ